MDDDRLAGIRSEIRKHADDRRAKNLRWFFRAVPGGYGEGDVFLGLRVPLVRKLAGKYGDTTLRDLGRLLCSEVHEERLLSLCILVRQYDKGDETIRARICRLYLRCIRHINNWDLVDISAPRILGRHLHQCDHSLLMKLARSRSVWERRIAVLATFYFIRQCEYDEALRIGDTLLHDAEDLIHKAVGWMLREIGNRSLETEEAFLKDRYSSMPRTMLRYAIEKFPEEKRRRYLLGTI